MNATIEAWLHKLCLEKRSGAAKAYRPYLLYFDDYLQRAGKSWAEAGKVDVLNFFAERDWSNATEYLAACAIRGFVRSLGIPSELASFKIKRKKSPPQRSISEAEFMALVGSLDTSTPKGKRDAALLMLAFDTGLRSIEICRLKLSDLDLPGQRLRVLGKGDQWRECVFSSVTANMLGAWLAVREQIAGPHDFVFCAVGAIGRNSPGGPLTRDGLRAIIKKLGRRIGLKLSPHDLRRGFASAAHRRGAPQYVAMLQGGWDDQETFKRYTTHRLDPSMFAPYFPTNCLLENGGNGKLKINVQLNNE